MNIHIHNLSRPFFDYMPETFDFDQNAFFFAEPGDVVVTRNPILSSEHFKFLQEIGAVKEGIVHVHSEIRSDDKAAVFTDQILSEQVEQRILSCSNTYVDSFEVTDLEDEWAEKLGLRVRITSKQADYFRRKSTFKKIARKVAVKTPAYISGLSTTTTTLIALGVLFVWRSNELVVKYDAAGRGIGTIRLNRELLLTWSGRKDTRHKLKDADARFRQQIVGPRLIEEWLSNVECSPSIQFLINDDGEVEYISAHIQIFGADRLVYGGCYSARKIPSQLLIRLKEEGFKVARGYSELGYRGTLSFDAVVSGSGAIHWIEANVHRALSSYATQIAKRVTGRTDAIYASLECVAGPGNRRSIKGLMEHLRPILYDRRKQTGIVPYNLALLPTNGYLSVLVLGDTFEKVEELKLRVLELL